MTETQNPWTFLEQFRREQIRISKWDLTASGEKIKVLDTLGPWIEIESEGPHWQTYINVELGLKVERFNDE